MTAAYFRTNTLATVTVILVVAYWTFGAIIPGRYVSSFGSCSVAVAGAALCFAASRDSWLVMKRGEVGPAELATLGIWSLGFGSFYRGAWGIIWTLAGYPPEWVGTVHSSFGNYVMTAGLFSIFVAPNAAKDAIRPPSAWVVALWVMAVVSMMAIVGMQIQRDDATNPRTVIEQSFGR